ncbi:MAG: SusC/RagA family TonB-linked outer membrane protein [Odoribacter sp.]|nr:SusC/RagA family TonB-linked outer membrane protein [Odoribacter sp.]
MAKFSFVLLCFCLQIQANGFSQHTRVSIKLDNVSVRQLFLEIEKMTDLAFVYNTHDVEHLGTMNVDFTNEEIDKILEHCLKGKGVNFSFVDNHVIIRKDNQNLPQQPVRVITGKIVDKQTGEVLPGATVKIKGTNVGTAADIQGQFKLTLTAEASALEVSFIGYKDVEVSVLNKEYVEILLESSTAEMEEVVITGFQRREKAVMVGSVSTATTRDLETAGVTTVDKALAGKLAGVYIRSTSGRPGETGKIQIRGINTMTGTTEPLYVLDGMPLQTGEVSGGINNLLTNGIGNIPPENIKSISILKDATAASIYGSRAANGVVVIETKMGEAGSDYISYTGKFGVTMAPKNQFDFMNTAEKIQLERELYDEFHPSYGGRVIQILNRRDNGTITASEAEKQISDLGKINTDWMKVLYRNAFSHSHNLTLSGGNAKTQYFTSFNYQKAQGTMEENVFQSGGLNMKLSRYVLDNLLVKFNLYSTIKKNQEGQSSMDVFKYATFANPYERPYDENGKYAADMTYRNLTNDITYNSDLNYMDFNILRELRENTLTNNYADIRGQFGVEWTFFKNFRYNGTVVANYTWVHDIDESQPGTYRSWAENWLNPAGGGKILPEYNLGFLKENTGRTFDYTVRNSIEYNNKFSGKHFVQVFFANEFGGRTNYRYNSFNPIYLEEYRIAGYPNWDLVSPDMYNRLKLEQFGTTLFAEDRSASFIGSLAYSYDDRYVFNGNIRYDGVDILGSDNQFAPLWSAGVKWNAHSERFLKSYDDILSRLVVSFGFGYRGSINRSVYPFHSYLLGSTVYDGIVSASDFRFGNPAIKWERKREMNLGLELSLLKGRINMEGRYFDEKITDLLDNLKLAPSVGRVEATVNVGEMSNRGFEYSMRLEVIKNRNVLWEIGGNLTKVKNNLDDVYENIIPGIANSVTQNIEGYPTNGWFGYKFSHVNPENGHVMVKAQRKESVVDGTSVAYQYADEVIDLSTITQKDLQEKYVPYYIGQLDPKFFGGFNTRVVYKQFELYANFVFATGNKILNFQDRKNSPDGMVDDITASRTNRLREVQYRWRQYGDKTNILYSVILLPIIHIT